MQELAKRYEGETGTKVEINSAGSGELLAHIELQKEGDLYVCHDPFLDVLMQKSLGVDGWTVAELTPVIAVRKGNPKGIKGLKDFTRKDLEIFLTDPRYSTLGHLLSTIFGKAGLDLDSFLKQGNVHTHRSGSQVGNMVVMGNADVCMVWNAVVALRKENLEAIPITPYLPVPYVDALTSATHKSYVLTPVRVSVATLRCAKHPKKAKAFAEFLASAEVADVLKAYGFTMTQDVIRKDYEAGKALPGTRVRCRNVDK
jgi:molybdate transport system substrate-binding protein